MRGPEGAEHAVCGSILEVVPGARIVFTDILLAGWRPTATPFLGFTAIITMEDEGARTRYAARLLHKNAEDAKKRDDMGFRDGWGKAIGQLEEVARRLAP